MSDQKDARAIYGSRQQWDLQREKQERAAKNRDERLHGEVINDDD
jgi:hypothetical protein